MNRINSLQDEQLAQKHLGLGQQDQKCRTHPNGRNLGPRLWGGCVGRARAMFHPWAHRWPGIKMRHFRKNQTKNMAFYRNSQWDDLDDFWCDVSFYISFDISFYISWPLGRFSLNLGRHLWTSGGLVLQMDWSRWHPICFRRRRPRRPLRPWRPPNGETGETAVKPL